MEPRSPLSSFDSGAVGVSAVEDNRAAAEPAFEVLVALLVLLLLLLLLELEVVPTAYCADVVLALDGAAATAQESLFSTTPSAFTEPVPFKHKLSDEDILLLW